MPAAILLIVSVVFYRLFAGTSSTSGLSEVFANFAPVAAIVFCGACFLPRRLAAFVAIGSLLASDLILNARYAASTEGVHLADIYLSAAFFLRYAAFAALFALGWWMARRDKRSLAPLVGGTIAGSLFFYLVSNTGAWLSTPEYAKSLAGWLQAQTTGLPGFPPAWTFLRASLLSDLLFTGLFILAVRPSLLKIRLPASVATTSPAPR